MIEVVCRYNFERKIVCDENYIMLSSYDVFRLIESVVEGYLSTLRVMEWCCVSSSRV